jgi:hypothetical protein
VSGEMGGGRAGTESGCGSRGTHTAVDPRLPFPAAAVPPLRLPKPNPPGAMMMKL